MRAQVEGLLARRYQITLLAGDCDIPPHPALTWEHVPTLPSPVILRYVSFQVGARLSYLAHRLRRGRPDLLQATQGQLVGADIVYAHFCHRAYLRGPWASSGVTGMRRRARWLNHAFNAWCEARAFRKASCIVVPSRGLAEEIGAHYPHCADKTVVIPNPVDVDRYRPPSWFDRRQMREQLAVPEGTVVLSFAALGDFHRKGLGLLIDALAALPDTIAGRLCLVVVGGSEGEIAAFRQRAQRAGVAELLRFVGFQEDVRPYLWASDVFVFPSSYETFSLVAHQAAAAGVPVLAAKGLHGVHELVQDGTAGWSVDRNPEALRQALQQVLETPSDTLASMGRRAAETVQRCHPDAFVRAWSVLYDRMLALRRARTIGRAA